MNQTETCLKMTELSEVLFQSIYKVYIHKMSWNGDDQNINNLYECRLVHANTMGL